MLFRSLAPRRLKALWDGNAYLPRRSKKYRRGQSRELRQSLR